MEKKWWQKEVVYQIYPRSFQDSNGDGIGDLQGIISRLDYLEDLGITSIWLCPIFKSPMADNGYDISDYLAIADEFGTMDDLKELIAESAKRHIKIILDLVINHTSDEHPWFQEALRNPKSPYHDYYIFKEGNKVPNNWRSVFGGSVWEKVKDRDEYYFHSYSKKQPDLNWENPQLRKELYQMINTWLDMGIAGFRVDAITYIKKDLSFESLESDGVDGLVKCSKAVRNQPGIEKFLSELKEETFQKYDCMTVAEAAGLRYDQLDAFIGDDGFFSMVFDFKYADLDIASGSEWFKRIPWSVNDLRKYIFDSQLNVQKYGWAANFIENHDQPRATTKYLLQYEKNSDAVKMLGAMYFFLRGTPFIYQGQELGMINFKRNTIDDFNDISSIDQYNRSIEEGYSKEEALEFVNLRSRDNARTPFPWNKDNGFSTHSPWLKNNNNDNEINVQKQINDTQSVLSFYKEMINFRQNSQYSDCLIYGSIEPIEVENNDVIAYRRQYNDMVIDCYFSFSNQAIEIKSNKIYDVIFQNMNDIEIQQIIKLKPFHAVLMKVREKNG
ncbi:MAG: alpha-glucosidase [Erysipelotrichaceae bacterium]|nr:alpha-glucosidase [Erysipelotrichaceae bacterium]